MSVIGFAFYLQPIAMPMLREMPPGEAGYKILSFCMRVTIMGAANNQCWSCRFADKLSDMLHEGARSCSQWLSAFCVELCRLTHVHHHHCCCSSTDKCSPKQLVKAESCQMCTVFASVLLGM